MERHLVSKHIKQGSWNVWLNGKLIDIIFGNAYCDGGAPITCEDQKNSLINHDGYDSGIKVTRRD